MRQVCVKPESFKFFNNSQIYYLEGIVTQPIIEENTIILPRGSVIQLTFNTQTLSSVNLSESKELVFTVDSIARDIFSRGRRLPRFTAININEDN